MFQLLFKYSPAAYANGHIVLLGAWPAWLLPVLILLFAAGLAWWLRRHLRHRRAQGVWVLRVTLVALILALLWQPALSVAELKPQQNIIAVLVDDSRSMALPANGSGPAGSGPSREAEAVSRLNAGLLRDLGRRFQTRLYTLDAGIARVVTPSQIQPTAPATRIGDSLRQLLDQTGDLPLGGIVLLTDGADNSGGLDRDTMAALTSRHVPVQTVGLGSTAAPHDVELDAVVLPPSALAQSRIEANVRFHQHGFSGQHALLTVRSGAAVLASQTVVFGRDDDIQTQAVMFNAGPAGAKALQFSLSPLPGEASPDNNTLTQVIDVTAGAHRILYIEGEPRWEYKFIREAEEGDPQVRLVSMLRATNDKIYRQGISDPSELADGFPSTPQDMFRYQGLIIGSVQANYFTPVQQDLIRAFADRRGGGILWMAGEYALGDGGWAESSMASLLPVTLPNHPGTFERADLGPGGHPHAVPLLTPAGANSIVTRLVDDPAANAKKWQQLPWLMDDQDVGAPKPGATVLANMRSPEGQILPLLITEPFGFGRTAVLASSGTWRWRMMLPLNDPTYDRFWQQLLRWLVAGTPGPVSASVVTPMLYDNGAVRLTAQVRDPQYNPTSAAQVQASILGPDGAAVTVPLQADSNVPGQFTADYTASRPGIYVANVSAPGFGQDVVAFDRQDGVAENFHPQQNRDLLQRLAQQTGGAYWRPDQTDQIAEAMTYSNSGVTLRQNLPLWNLPIAFLLLLLLPLAEWFLRRKWGVV